MAAAAASTMAYATAWLALRWQARVRAGQDVLIHSAAGGVGHAALALTLDAGCRVFATASTAEKRAALIERGAVAVFDSRDAAAFTAGVRAATAGRGVGVVRNLHSGASVTRKGV